LLMIALGLSFVFTLAHQDVTKLFAKSAASEFGGKSTQPAGVSTKPVKAVEARAIYDEYDCGCNANENGQYCHPSGEGCEVPPTPWDGQGCGQKTGGPNCGEGSCCTKIFT
jgi:hypothetical protein